MRRLMGRLSVGILGAAAFVFCVQSPSSADAWQCSPSGQYCIHEQLDSKPGGSIIWARFDNTDSTGNNVAVQLWATDVNDFVGQNPRPGEGQYKFVAGGGHLDYGSNFLPLGDKCHFYIARIVYKDGRVRWSPTIKYCYNDTK